MDERSEYQRGWAKAANNLITIVISRAAMIVTPPILLGAIALAWSVWGSMEARISALEVSRALQSQDIRDVRQSMEFSSKARDQMQDQTSARLSDLSASINGLNTQLTALTLTTSTLATIINERVPKKADP